MFKKSPTPLSILENTDWRKTAKVKLVAEIEMSVQSMNKKLAVQKMEIKLVQKGKFSEQPN